MTVSLKKKKKEQLACLTRKTINKKFTKIRKLPQIIGKIAGALQGSRFLALYNRGLDKNKQYCLQKSKYNYYKAYVELFQESITELTWWQENLPYMLNKISEDAPTANIYSDVSDNGWGAHFQFNITPKIDLFAWRLNNQLPTYVSYKPDPNAYAVDLFSLDWSKPQLFAFHLLIVYHSAFKR